MKVPTDLVCGKGPPSDSGPALLAVFSHDGKGREFFSGLL